MNLHNVRDQAAMPRAAQDSHCAAGLPDDAALSARGIADLVGLPADLLQVRLNRWRSRTWKGWYEVTGGCHSTRFLYRWGDVKGLVMQTAEESRTK